MTNFLCSVSSFFSGILYILLALLVLMIMIVIHEAGHYTAGKIFKFKINEFSIGFGKALYKKTKKNGEVFAIRMIPLGGYCAFEGEDDDENESPEAFNKQAWWKRLIVLFSGAFFNFISAVLFSIVLLAVVGSGYSNIENVDGINPNQYVIESETLQIGDVVKRVNGEKCSFLNGAFNGMVSAIQDDTTIITITVERVVDGEKIEKDIQIRKHAEVAKNEVGNVIKDADGNPTYNYLLGVTSSWHNFSFGESLLRAFPFACEMAWECVEIFGKLIIGQYSIKNLGGPITTISSIATASQTSMLNLLLLFPLIAVNLAVFNLLPIPALDGARMVFVSIEAIRRKPINRDLEAKIHGIGLIVLFSFVIIVDILQLFVF